MFVKKDSDCTFAFSFCLLKDKKFESYVWMVSVGISTVFLLDVIFVCMMIMMMLLRFVILRLISILSVWVKGNLDNKKFKTKKKSHNFC